MEIIGFLYKSLFSDRKSSFFYGTVVGGVGPFWVGSGTIVEGVDGWKADGSCHSLGICKCLRAWLAVGVTCI